LYITSITIAQWLTIVFCCVVGFSLDRSGNTVICYISEWHQILGINACKSWRRTSV